MTCKCSARDLGESPQETKQLVRLRFLPPPSSPPGSSSGGRLAAGPARFFCRTPLLLTPWHPLQTSHVTSCLVDVLQAFGPRLRLLFPPYPFL